MCNLYIIKMRREKGEGREEMVHRRDGGWKGLTIIQSKDKCVVG